MLHEQSLRADLATWFAAQPPPVLFAPYADRASWEALPPDAVKHWLDMAESRADYVWPALVMTNWLRIKRDGETFSGWQKFTERRSLLGVFLIAECMEGSGRFFDQIVNGIITVCEETSWVQMLNMREKNFALPDESDNYVDLCAAETAQLFAWISALMGDRLDAEDKGIRERMEREVMRRVVRPYIDRDDYWWMGFTPTRINNWNPWCNQNVIEAIMFMRFGPAIKAQVIRKVCRSLDVYLDRYPEDGACDEGPGYWSAAGLGLGTCVDLLKRATGGMVDGSGAAKLKAIASYYYKVHIGKEWYVNFADGDARLSLPPGVFRLGELVGDEKLTDMGRFAKPGAPGLAHWFSIYSHLMGLFDAPRRSQNPARAAYLERAVFKDCEILCAREKPGEEHGFFLCAKGGNNVESHNHNDIGNFVAFLDGEPLFIDLGTEEYSLKTFSKDRFSIWYLQSQYHNCPTIAGNLQQDGNEFLAEGTRIEVGDSDIISMELRRAYPEDTAVESWRRSIALHRGHTPRIEVRDAYRGLGKGITSYNFISRAKPTACADVIYLDVADGAEASLTYDHDALDVTIEDIPITESRLLRNWGGMVWRIVFSEKRRTPDAERVFTLARA